MLPAMNQELLEKPSSKEDNLRMLLDMNGNVCEVVTGVVIGEIRLSNVVWILLICDLQHTLSSQLRGT
jgi:predicted house-cleaning NTP pyrophosphatase (Maf/HAM1 superfamily)